MGERLPSGSAMAWFTHLIARLVQNFATAAAQFNEEALGAASDFADAAGKVAGTIGPAVEGFAAMATLSAPSEAAIDNLARGIRAIVRKFAQMATELDSDGTKATGDFADAAGKALAAAKSGVELFAAMAGDKDQAGNRTPIGIPSATAIDQLAAGIKYVIGKFREMAQGMENEGIAQMQTFASAAGQVFAAAKSGTDLFKDMEKLAVPSEDAINYLLGTIGSIITKVRLIANGIGEAGLREAQSFATGALQVIATINAALESFKSIEQYKGIPLKMLDELFAELANVLKRAHDIFLRSESIKTEMQFFAANMKEALRLANEGLALGQQIPGAPATAPAGVGTATGGATGTATGGATGGTTVNVNMNGDVYDGAGFESRVVSAITIATQRGRL